MLLIRQLNNNITNINPDFESRFIALKLKFSKSKDFFIILGDSTQYAWNSVPGNLPVKEHDFYLW